MAFLKRLSQTPEERKATTICAFIGQMTGQRAFEFASRTFCVIDGDQLNAVDFGTGFIHVVLQGQSRATSQSRSLRQRTRLVDLGEAGVFCSHSWHDDGEARWHALHSWMAEFKQTVGRPPAVWCDIACIDQQQVHESLAALPLYLAGCHRLLALTGPSFVTRLWCIMELYTFIMMGASLDRVIVLPIGDQTMARTLQSFSEFDVVHADCYQYRDKQHLLAIIESGFGSFAAFDSIAPCNACSLGA